MGYKLIVTPEAEEDIDEAAKWLDSQKEELSHKFLPEIGKLLLNIKNGPLHYQVKYKEVRVAFTKKFSTGIHYTVTDKIISVHFVVYARKESKFY